MNRNDHLAQTIQQWLHRDWVEQVVVVDWSSSIPVAETLRDVPKDKISIIRAEGEEHWILSYAYNLGVSHAKCDQILKIDADCFVSDHLITQNHPDERTFCKGEPVGPPSGPGFDRAKWAVLGQCFFTRAAFESVNGYNELLRGYGYDDVDFYFRLKAKGFSCEKIDSDLFTFIDHSDDDRCCNIEQRSPKTSAQYMLENTLIVQTKKNKFISHQMPWGRWFPRAGYQQHAIEDCVIHVERKRDLEIKIPPAVADFAQRHGVWEVLKFLGVNVGETVPADYAIIIKIFEQWIIQKYLNPNQPVSAA